ncbi:MAG: tetratricopeptide repeat protein [Deltaproteobacteria bacterium]|nr:tetratricopeptide repeat protein [Deltaproteobacteria bacterium]
MEDFEQVENLLLKEAENKIAKGEYTSAQELIGQVLKQSPEDGEAHYLLGTIAYRRGELDQAIQSLKRAITANPQHTDAMLSLSILYNDIGAYELGSETYNILQQTCQQQANFQDKRLNARIARHHIGLARIYTQYRRYDEALEEYSKAQQLAPSDAEIKVGIARLYLEKGDPQQAVAHLERIAAKHPEYTEAFIQLGLAHSAAGNKADALAALKKVAHVVGCKEIIEQYMRMLQ